MPKYDPYTGEKNPYLENECTNVDMKKIQDDVFNNSSIDWNTLMPYASEVYTQCMHLDWELFESSIVSKIFRDALLSMNKAEVCIAVLNATEWYNKHKK